jgi:hypothetical protein
MLCSPLLPDSRHVFDPLRQLGTQIFDDYTPLPSMLLDALLSKLQQETILGKLLVMPFVISVIITC